MWASKATLLRSVITVVVELDTEPDTDVVIDRVERMSLATAKLRQRRSATHSPARPRAGRLTNFDLSYHLRWERVPARTPACPKFLNSPPTISEQDFDRARPLWEIHVVTGLEGGRAAFIIKIHHAITDGVQGMMLAASLFDLTREPNTDLPQSLKLQNHTVPMLAVDSNRESKSSWRRRSMSSRAARVGWEVWPRRLPKIPLSSVVDAQEWAASAGRLLAPNVRAVVRHLDRALVVGCVLRDRDSPRRFEEGRKGSWWNPQRRLHGGGDGGLALYHDAHGSHPEALRVNMPINVRSEGDSDAGNRWVPARFVVPVNVTDAADRMKQLHPILPRRGWSPRYPCQTSSTNC